MKWCVPLLLLSSLSSSSSPSSSIHSFKQRQRMKHTETWCCDSIIAAANASMVVGHVLCLCPYILLCECGCSWCSDACVHVLMIMTAYWMVWRGLIFHACSMFMSKCASLDVCVCVYRFGAVSLFTVHKRHVFHSMIYGGCANRTDSFVQTDMNMWKGAQKIGVSIILDMVDFHSIISNFHIVPVQLLPLLLLLLIRWFSLFLPVYILKSCRCCFGSASELRIVFELLPLSIARFLLSHFSVYEAITNDIFYHFSSFSRVDTFLPNHANFFISFTISIFPYRLSWSLLSGWKWFFYIHFEKFFHYFSARKSCVCLSLSLSLIGYVCVSECACAALSRFAISRALL